ncbi:hypothetical protein HDU97_010419 [Phlyctochytrium planicorne]|nr:hypothetical protein HDU97_010419 [Phlyctochytrium planicorne]
MTPTPVPFKIHIPDEAIEELRARLEKGKVPDELAENSRWSQGIDRDYLLSLIEYWKNGFDWRKQEELLNRMPQFTVDIDGKSIHFCHLRSSRPDAKPLLLSHGWPGSFFEFHKVLEPLTNPPPGSPAFHVVAPSLPGYGFSYKPTNKGFGLNEIAEIFVKLMDILGYPTFYAQGGDWGSGVTRVLALNHPKNVLGNFGYNQNGTLKVVAIHLNLAFAPIPSSLFYIPKRVLLNIYPWAVLAKEDVDSLLKTLAWAKNEAGYYRIQGTKPYSLAVGLTDSPIGLLAWIGEKMRVWTTDSADPSAGGISADEVLTNVSIYWFTETIGSSFRLYKEEKNLVEFYKQRVNQPTGVAIFPMEISKPPKEWLGYNHNLLQYTKMPRGGHFAALEEPELLMADVRDFFQKVNNLKPLSRL